MYTSPPKGDDEGGFIVAVEGSEQMGSKAKFWCKRVGTEERYLLKYPRPDTGEDWAEKIAAELAGDGGLRLPRARVDFATFEGRRAVLVRDFLGDGDRLIHGNELLLERDPDYPSDLRRVRQHTLASVFEVLDVQAVQLPAGVDLPDQVRTAADLYSGYLVLDALIGNTDRHHENWGILLKRAVGAARVLTLAPTYDHGSCLGRELRDEERRRRVTTVDTRSNLPAYAERARSAFYGAADAPSPLGTFDLLRLASEHRGSAVRAWIERMVSARRELPYEGLVERVPPTIMSIEAKEFTRFLLEYNFNRIQEAVG
jgi:hypothetical protein